jgi:5-methylcytosine-specific restriction enzyme subunit McrC
MGIDDLLAVGQTRSFAFLLDMNQLFERFVERFVTHALSRSAYQVQVQQRDRAIIWDVAAQRPYTHIVPDLLIQADRNGRRLALDAKYKLYDERRLSTADIYQSFFYAYAYNDAGQEQPAALLLYPASRTGQQPVSLRVQGQQRVGKANLYALPISIPQAIKEIASGQFGPLSQLLFESVTSHLADEEG